MIMVKQKTYVVHYGPSKQWSGDKTDVLDELSKNMEILEVDESVKLIIRRIE